MKFFTDNCFMKMFNHNKKISAFIVLMCVSICTIWAEVYREKATVSFYAGDFHGKKTSNGENFNMNDFTCASKSLPFDTILKVTNLANGKSVQVRVNDRGPFVADRELDLSKAAAQKLDMIKSGTATVKIEIVKRGPDTKLSQQTAAKAAQIMAQKTGSKKTVKEGQTFSSQNKTTSASDKKKSYAKGTYWDIQVGAYSTRENANKVAQKLLKQGFTNVIFQKGNDIFRVVIKGVPAEKVPSVDKKLNSLGYKDYVIRERKK